MQGSDAIVAVVVFGGIAAVVVPLARAVAKRIAGGAGGAREIETLRDEVAQLRAEMEGVQGRLSDVDEIQNRLDFAERLLAQARERGLLNPPKEH
jgi:hypothetical protein